MYAVDSASTSQPCSGGGREVRKGLSTRWQQRPYEACGLSLQRERDHNAAKHMLALGKLHRGAGTPLWR